MSISIRHSMFWTEEPIFMYACINKTRWTSSSKEKACTYYIPTPVHFTTSTNSVHSSNTHETRDALYLSLHLASKSLFDSSRTCCCMVGCTWTWVHGHGHPVVDPSQFTRGSPLDRTPGVVADSSASSSFLSSITSPSFLLSFFSCYIVCLRIAISCREMVRNTEENTSEVCAFSWKPVMKTRRTICFPSMYLKSFSNTW